MGNSFAGERKFMAKENLRNLQNSREKLVGKIDEEKTRVNDDIAKYNKAMTEVDPTFTPIDNIDELTKKDYKREASPFTKEEKLQELKDKKVKGKKIKEEIAELEKKKKNMKTKRKSER